MKIFPDTSFLCSIYREQIHSHLADKTMNALDVPLSVSTLLLFEFRNSLRFQPRLYKQDKTRGVSPKEAEGMLSDLQSDLNLGVLEIVQVDWADVHATAERLSASHTTAHGHRFADILHVATAIHLGAEVFLSFDENQKRLAKAEGLATEP